MEKKLTAIIGGLLYTAAILVEVICHVEYLASLIEEPPAVVTNDSGIEFHMATGYEVQHCTAIAAQAAMAHQGYEVSAAKIAAATCLPGSNCDLLGRYMHNAADIALEQAGDDRLQRNLSHATNIEELVSEMIANHAFTAIVSVQVPKYYHAVAVVVEKDGSWRVIDAAMTTTLVYGGAHYAKINAWSGEIRRGQNWYFTSTQM